MPEKVKKCMLCGKPSTESICEPCKASVQGEAAEKKIKIDKPWLDGRGEIRRNKSVARTDSTATQQAAPGTSDQAVLPHHDTTKKEVE